MSERLADIDPLTEAVLHGQNLRTWHRVLTTDAAGEPTGHLSTPVSRYGRNANECAYWAIAAEVIYVDANGENTEDDPREALDYYMGLTVNDSDSILELVLDHWHATPEALRQYLDYETPNGLTMAQQVALSGLCRRYNVGYDYEHYQPQFELPDDYVAGWVGGPNHGANSERPTIYVGVSASGEVSS